MAARSDRWDSSLYDDRHSFVWRAGASLVELLNAQPGERILDLGCGTGHLTAKIAETGADVTGLDSSMSMIAQARQNFPGLRFVLGDARDFGLDEASNLVSPRPRGDARPAPADGAARHCFDAVFSNAALHWIHEAGSVAGCVAAILRPGGRFVLEMGARGNVERIRQALESVLRDSGREPRCPWFFPGAGEYAALLERCGFEVRMAQTFDRWTRLEHPERGLREWIEMFAGSWLEGVPAPERSRMLGVIEERLRPELYRDGAWWADYRRLRVDAVRTGDASECVAPEAGRTTNRT